MYLLLKNLFGRYILVNVLAVILVLIYFFVVFHFLIIFLSYYCSNSNQNLKQYVFQQTHDINISVIKVSLVYERKIMKVINYSFLKILISKI